MDNNNNECQSINDKEELSVNTTLNDDKKLHLAIDNNRPSVKELLLYDKKLDNMWKTLKISDNNIKSFSTMFRGRRHSEVPSLPVIHENSTNCIPQKRFHNNRSFKKKSISFDSQDSVSLYSTDYLAKCKKQQKKKIIITETFPASSSPKNKMKFKDKHPVLKAIKSGELINS